MGLEYLSIFSYSHRPDPDHAIRGNDGRAWISGRAPGKVDLRRHFDVYGG